MLYSMSMAQDVASAQLCARCGNTCDGDVTHHKVVVCVASCVATARLGWRRPLAQPQDWNAEQI